MAVAYAQTLRIEELVKTRIKAAQRFQKELNNSKSVLSTQFCPPNYTNTYWTWVKLRKDIDWIKFRDEFVKNVGWNIFTMDSYL